MSTQSPYHARASSGFCGSVSTPSDKSISHRALMISSIALGVSEVHHLLPSEDVHHTLSAMRALGVRIEEHAGVYTVHGVGLTGLQEPKTDLDFGNSGTGARLTLGLLASTPLRARCTGDRSLQARPMGRVMAPLRLMGADFLLEQGERFPTTLLGAKMPLPITYSLPVPSAQVKSAILLAALNTPGITTVIERIPTRDHTERMLLGFGAHLDIQDLSDERHIRLTGQQELHAQRIEVPSDPSSAAFLLVAALLCPKSHLEIPNVLLNPTRTGLFKTLQDMGADLHMSDVRDRGGERVGTLVARTSSLNGVFVPASRAPSMIDEYPILAIAAAFARGKTRMEGLGELRVKESDRLAALAEGLALNGVPISFGEDWLEVEGNPDLGSSAFGGALVKTHMDHRIAMAFLVMGLCTEKGVSVDDASMIATSFPDFLSLMESLGAKFQKL